MTTKPTIAELNLAIGRRKRRLKLHDAKCAQCQAAGGDVNERCDVACDLLQEIDDCREDIGFLAEHTEHEVKSHPLGGFARSYK